MSPRTEFNIHDAVVEGNITAIQKMVHGGVSLETPDKVCSLIFRIKHMLDCVELAFLEVSCHQASMSILSCCMPDLLALLIARERKKDA